jgi:hypothetical protein
MKLYTVEIVFSDFTNAIGQHEADSPGEAVELFFKSAECFEGYDRDKLVSVIQRKVNNKNLLLHVADNLRGVWLIIFGEDFSNFSDDLEAIYGGFVIQTDPHGPRRSG